MRKSRGHGPSLPETAAARRENFAAQFCPGSVKPPRSGPAPGLRFCQAPHPARRPVGGKNRMAFPWKIVFITPGE